MRAAASGLVAALLAVSCGGDDSDNPGRKSSDAGGAYASRTDGRGWAVSDEGLFGHRRGSAPPAASGTMGGMGYAQGSEAAPLQTGVLIHERDRATPGLNLMNSGDAAEAVLTTNGGEVVHVWKLPYEKIDGAPPLQTPFQIPWRRVHLRPDGSLLAIHSDAALVHLDRDSNVRWTLFDRVHHDLDVREGPGGPTTFLLSRVERVVPSVNPDEPVLDDLVIEVDGAGRVQRRVSLWTAFEASEWGSMLERLNQREGDVMHANSIDILDEGEAAAFQDPAVVAGHILVCMRDLDLLVVLDFSAEKLVWLSPGPAGRSWRGPHDPTFTDAGAGNGTLTGSPAGPRELLLFDNLGGPASNSRILRFPPGAASFAWSWQGSPPESFSSVFCGTVQALPTGHVLATESCHGRAVEIDPASGDIVWEFVSDRVAGDHDELIAALFE
ncbi:MAG: arylsulfotransferase family protein, partial [Planctomycetota bacterium]